jgi:hypothetical protein
MSDIKKFDDFNKAKNKKFNRTHKFEPMSNDITKLAKLDNGEYEEIEEPVEIVQVMGLITDEEEIKKIDKKANENITLDTSMTITDIKRGDIIYLTALLKKKDSTAWNSQQIGIIKCRIVDYFYGLNKINTIKQKR